jgi:hypothetical protein
VSPILIRPSREQDEHDRLIRFLREKYSRKFEVAINPRDEQQASVKILTNTHFPDLVLSAGKKLAGLVEVESGESVNNLEAMAQWVPFSKARVPFFLYVPVHAYDAARRLSEANHVRISEIWTYRPTNEGFDLVRAFNDTSAASASKAAGARTARPGAAATPAKPAARRVERERPSRSKRAVAKTAKPRVRPARSAKKPVAKPRKAASARKR